MVIERSRVTDQLVEMFVKKINSGKWKAGEKIPSENQLKDALGVSRASIRNAIQYLVALGVLESQHGKGTFLLVETVDLNAANESRITAEDYNDIEKVLEFRLAVESECAYLAAANATPELVKKLRRELEYMKKNTDKQDVFVKHDIKFHEIISKASQNTLLEKSLVNVFSEKIDDHRQMNTLFGYEDGINYHTELVEAIEASDSKLAYRTMHAHMQNAIERLKSSRKGNTAKRN